MIEMICGKHGVQGRAPYKAWNARGRRRDRVKTA